MNGSIRENEFPNYKNSKLKFSHFFSGFRPFLCSTCGKGFTQASNLRQHVLRHSQNKQFKCSKCESAFVTKGELVTHDRTHTKDHPFVCDVCDTAFTTSSSLVSSPFLSLIKLGFNESNLR